MTAERFPLTGRLLTSWLATKVSISPTADDVYFVTFKFESKVVLVVFEGV